jgi:hypothetical protein
VEHGGGGGDVAVPVAKQVFEAILAESRSQPQTDSAKARIANE